jgi:Ankyrin repeat
LLRDCSSLCLSFSTTGSSTRLTSNAALFGDALRTKPDEYRAMEQQDDASDMMNSRVHHRDDDEQLLDQGNNKKRHKLLVSIAEPPENGAMQENDENDEQSGEESQEENKDTRDEESSENEDNDESMNQQQVGRGAEDDDDSQFSEGDEDGDDENSFSFIQEHLPEWHEDVLSFGVARRLNEMLISSPGDLTRIRAVMQQHSPAILDPLYFLNYEKQRQLDDDATDRYILTGAEYVNGWPVHISLESSAPMPVILYLLQLFPQQAHLEKRRPSLHWACRGVRNRMDMIAFFYARAPETVSQRDSQGKLPLHHFLWDCYGESSLDIFEFLIAKYPRAIRTRDCFGRYPLHYACDNDDMTLEMVKFLVADFPKALTVPDKSG